MYGKQYELFARKQKTWEQILDFIPWPNNVKSIIYAIADEVQNNYNKELIKDLLLYYFNSFYKRLFNQLPNQRLEYENKVNFFIHNLTNNNIIKQIINFLYNIYINYLDDNMIVYVLNNNHIRTIKQLKLYKIDLLNTIILFADKFDNYTINNINIKNVPRQLKSIINQLILNSNNQLIKYIIFINDVNNQYQKIQNYIYINYNSNIEDLKNNVIKALREV